MNLRSGYPYWLLQNGLLNNYPSLKENLKVDTLIIGGGITGALVAWHLQEAGISTAVIDRRHIGTGSTCASTSLLQYEIDVPLHKLVKLVGEHAAVKSYKMCIDAINSLEKLHKKIKSKAEFESRKSLFMASYKKDIESLQLEYSIRTMNDIDVEFLDAASVLKKTGIETNAALLSNQAAQMDVYRFTHDLLQFYLQKGGKVFDKTTVTRIEHKNNSVKLCTSDNISITAKNYVVATGYESQSYFNIPFTSLHSTYVIISEPLKEVPFDLLIWESKTPYLYMRTTPDKRIIVGGRDEMFYSPGKRDNLLTRKSSALLKDFKKYFPETDFKIDFSWTGTFAETKDGLPFIGNHNNYPNAYFALGFGGNGIVFSLIAAEYIRDHIKSAITEKNNIFSFNRVNN